MINFPSILTAAVKRRNRGGLPSGYSLLLDAADTNSYPGSGTSWFDLSGNGNHCTMAAGMTWNASGYMNFDATSTSYGSIVHADSNTPTTAFSLLAWVYPTSGSSITVPRTIMSKRVTAANGNYSVFFLTSGALFADCPNSSYRNASSVYAAGNMWEHWSVVYNGTNVSFYKNGAFDVSRTSVLGSFSPTTHPVYIGALPGNDHRFGGRMGHIAYYNERGLTASEVLQAYNTHKNRYGL
jgi:hypothetical protein